MTVARGGAPATTARVLLLLALAAPLGCDRGSGDELTAGEPVSTSLGVEMPPGVRRVSRSGEVGHEGAAQSVEYLVTAADPVTTAAFFASRSSVPPVDSRTFFIDGVTVLVTDADEIPRDGDELVLDEPPAGARAWLTVHRISAPPACPPCPDGFTGTLLPGCDCD